MDGRSVRRVRATGGDGAEDAHGPEVLEHAVHAAEAVASSAAPGAVVGAATRPLRLLLVQVPHDEGAEPRVLRAVQRLVGADARVVGSAEPTARRLAEAVATTLDASVAVTAAWDGTAPGVGADARVREAYRGLAAEGGTVVAVTSRRGVLSVLAEVLATPTERFWALATAPGSLSAVEVWEDGSASVAFTNRTDHLA
jgi:probable phosphoglycerate mutase